MQRPMTHGGSRAARQAVSQASSPNIKRQYFQAVATSLGSNGITAQNFASHTKIPLHEVQH
jgi:hypothetical protein